MNARLDQPTLRQRIAPLFQGFDSTLGLAALMLGAAGLLAMYSAGHDHGTDPCSQ